MRTLVASAVYVSLATGIFAQQPVGAQPRNGVLPPNGEAGADRVAFTNRQVRLVDSYRDSGDYRAAERVLREWLAMEPAGSATSVTIRNTLADLLREEGRRTEARQLFRQIADAPEVSSQQRLNALIGLTEVDLNEGDLKMSISEANAALELARGQRDSRSEAIVLRGLGRAWLNAKSAGRAEPLLRRSLWILENDAAAEPLQIAESLGAMAGYYRAVNKLALAEEAWSRALTIKRALFGEGHPQVAYLMDMLAEVYSARGESDLACDYAARAANVMRQRFGDASPPAAAALANLALVEQRAHTLGAAASNYEAAVRALRRSPDQWPTLKIVMQRYAGVLKAMHRDGEAKAVDTEVKGLSFQSK
jgi:tetratricopeptide (TPR) repeat protein